MNSKLCTYQYVLNLLSICKTYFPNSRVRNGEGFKQLLEGWGHVSEAIKDSKIAPAVFSALVKIGNEFAHCRGFVVYVLALQQCHSASFRMICPQLLAEAPLIHLIILG